MIRRVEPRKFIMTKKLSESTTIYIYIYKQYQAIMATTDISIKIARLRTTLEADTQKLTDTANRMSDIANQIAELTKTNERL